MNIGKNPTVLGNNNIHISHCGKMVFFMQRRFYQSVCLLSSKE